MINFNSSKTHQLNSANAFDYVYSINKYVYQFNDRAFYALDLIVYLCSSNMSWEFEMEMMSYKKPSN